MDSNYPQFQLKIIPAHVNWVCANWKVLCAAPVGSFYNPAAQLKGSKHGINSK